MSTGRSFEFQDSSFKQFVPIIISMVTTGKPEPQASGVKEAFLFVFLVFFMVKSGRDSQHHLRLVGDAGGRFTGRFEGIELCADPGRAAGDVAGGISRRIFPAVYEFLRSPHAER